MHNVLILINHNIKQMWEHLWHEKIFEKNNTSEKNGQEQKSYNGL